MILFNNRLETTPAALCAAEQELRSALGCASVMWSGRAATALHWAYRIAALAGEPVEVPEVIVPAISCATPATCALSAGWKVRFADVDPATGMPTLDLIRERWTPATRAVVFIHLYGQTADLAPLADWCHSHGAVLIEDLAQAQGARFPNGQPAGSTGDMAVYSFNRTKILDCGGGALSLRTQLMADVCHRLSCGESEIDSRAAEDLALSQRNLYHSLVLLRRTHSATDVATAFLSVNSAYSPLYVRSLQNPCLLADKWNCLRQVIASRDAKASVYSSKLANGPWKLLEGWRASGVCWRYSLLVDFPDTMTEFVGAVRNDGFYVSNLYWPLNELIYPRDSCPNAEFFARRIVNLWVDEYVDFGWVERCAQSLCSHARGV